MPSEVKRTVEALLNAEGRVVSLGIASISTARHAARWSVLWECAAGCTHRSPAYGCVERAIETVACVRGRRKRIERS